MTVPSFIRAAEVWIPNAEGSHLAFGGGLYGASQEFGDLSRTLTFKRGEGLPGEAWASRHPIVMKTFEAARFRRTQAAEAIGITSGVAMPIFAGEAIKAVVVLLCGTDEDHVGAIEVWQFDPALDAQMGLHDGFYGGAELFERTSRMVRFGRGSGLPGMVWASAMPVVLHDLYGSHRFLRREEALKVGLTFGLGLPFDYDPGRMWVMAFLSALGSPIASSFETWIPDQTGERLLYDNGVYAVAGKDGMPARPPSIEGKKGFIGNVLSAHVPTLTEDCSLDAPWLLGDHAAQTTRAAIAIPVLDARGTLKAVTVWSF